MHLNGGKHAVRFEVHVMPKDDIIGLIFQALDENKIVGFQGRGRPIYEYNYKRVIRIVAITVSNNGFIVGQTQIKE